MNEGGGLIGAEMEVGGVGSAGGRNWGMEGRGGSC